MKNQLLLLLPLLALAFTNAFGQTATAYYESGVEKYKKENYRGALKDLNKAIEMDPNYAEAFFVRGNVSYGRFNQNLSKAKEDYTTAIKLNPQFLKAFYNRGLANMDLEKYTDAIDDFTKVIEIDPYYIKAYQIRAQVKKLIGDVEGATFDAETALDIKSSKTNPSTAIAGSNIEDEKDAINGDSLVVSTLVANKTMYVDMSAFVSVEKDINFAGVQLHNAWKTFGVGFFLNLIGGALATGGYFAKDPKVQTGLVAAGGVTSLVGSVVMITAVIPIGGAGKILQRVRFPKRVEIDLEQPHR